GVAERLEIFLGGREGFQRSHQARDDVLLLGEQLLMALGQDDLLVSLAAFLATGSEHTTHLRLLLAPVGTCPGTSRSERSGTEAPPGKSTTVGRVRPRTPPKRWSW